MSRKPMTIPSVIHTIETDTKALKTAIANYHKRAGYTPAEIKAVLYSIENVEHSKDSIVRYVNRIIPGKKNEENRQRLTAAMVEYLALCKSSMAVSFGNS